MTIIENLNPSGKVEKEAKRDYLLFKATGDKNRPYFPWSKEWKIPRNAIVGLGIPPDEKRPLIIAFSPRLPSHASLDTTINRVCPDCDYVSASLNSYNGHGVLTILTLTEEDRKKAEEAGVVIKKPTEILTDADLKVITEALGAHEYNFVTESRHLREIHKPTGGINHLRRKLKTTSGD